MTEKTETRAQDVLDAYRERLASYREKLAWVKDYL